MDGRKGFKLNIVTVCDTAVLDKYAMLLGLGTCLSLDDKIKELGKDWDDSEVATVGLKKELCEFVKRLPFTITEDTTYYKLVTEAEMEILFMPRGAGTLREIRKRRKNIYLYPEVTPFIATCCAYMTDKKVAFLRPLRDDSWRDILKSNGVAVIDKH